MAGRRPKPTEIKLLAGNPGKRKLPEILPQLPLGAPEAPDSVKDDAIALLEWHRIVPELMRLCLLSIVDMASLAGYCQAFSLWQQASANVHENGIMISGPLGVRKNPAVGIMNDAWKQVRAFAAEFGLSPASRSKVTHVPSETPDTFEQFLFEPEEDSGNDLNPFIPKIGPM